ncbi:MAG: uroporphyrinogen-III C-methyltransferase [Chromatiales bacterium]|jgi:uroporphyrin-3 C-methyltransferase
MSEKENGRARSGKDAEFKDAIEGEVEVIADDSNRGGVSRLSLILATLALLMTALGLFFGYRYWSQMEQTLKQFDAALEQANRQQTELAEQLQQAQLETQKQQQAIAAQEQTLKEQYQRLQAAKEESKRAGEQLYHSLSEMQTRLGGKQSQWRVAEAEYLLRVANHRLNLMADPETALEALKAADGRLSATGDPGWAPVRDLVAREITQLTALPKVDQAGISAELVALADQLDQLSLKNGVVPMVAEERAVEAAAAEAANEGLGLQQVVDDLWRGFKSMMVIRHHDKPVSAMLPPEQRYFLLENMRLKLEAAKAALMGRNQSLYEDNLKAAVAWTETYFEAADPGVVGFRQQLVGLAQRQVAPALPDISGSLRALQMRRQRLSREAIQ